MAICDLSRPNGGQLPFRLRMSLNEENGVSAQGDAANPVLALEPGLERQVSLTASDAFTAAPHLPVFRFVELHSGNNAAFPLADSGLRLPEQSLGLRLTHVDIERMAAAAEAQQDRGACLWIRVGFIVPSTEMEPIVSELIKPETMKERSLQLRTCPYLSPCGLIGFSW